MNAAPFIVEPLNGQRHKRSAFDCGAEPLNHYLQAQAGQDIRRRVAACYVAVAENGQIAGYYTLAAASVMLNELPAATGKKLPRYPTVPVIRMGRLAVDIQYQGSGLGGALLADAVQRSRDAGIAAFALLVDAKDEQASRFYRHHGFIALPDALLTLFLPI